MTKVKVQNKQIYPERSRSPNTYLLTVNFEGGKRANF
jgi:hypothetical protein